MITPDARRRDTLSLAGKSSIAVLMPDRNNPSEQGKRTPSFSCDSHLMVMLIWAGS